MKDLFGTEIVESFIPVKGQKRKELANGYPYPPGSGPAGETCGGCEHKTKIKIRSGRAFWKCLKFKSPSTAGQKRQWSGCYASDIRLKSPACKLWEAALSKTPKRFGLGVRNRNVLESKGVS